MKRLWLLGVLATMLVLPVFAQAETWADFVTRAGEAVADGTAQVVLETKGTVEACGIDEEYYDGMVEPLDPPLTVPEGVRLSLRGEDFEDVTGVSRREDYPAIYLDNPDMPLNLSLELGHDTLVRSMDIRSEVIASMWREERAAQSFPVLVHIINHGYFEAYVDVEAHGIDLSFANAGPDTVRILLENYGDISPDVRLFAVSHGDAEAILLNQAYAGIEDKDGRSIISASSRDGVATVREENDEGARIAVTGGYDEEDPALALSVNQYAFDDGAAEGRIMLQNAGRIEGFRGLSVGVPLSEGGTGWSGGTPDVVSYRAISF